MDTYRVELTAAEFSRLNSLWPKSTGSGDIGKRAEQVVRIHFVRRTPGCTFEVPSNGADLKVIFADGKPPLFVEIKGTASAEIAFQQLKVSSQHSYRSLVDKGVPVYRVCNVFSRTPEIHVLIYGVDFALEPEGRWAFKPHPTEQLAKVQTKQSVATSKQSVSVKASSKSKYNALREFLINSGETEVSLSFRDARKILGFDLPASAQKYQAFWANQTDVTARPWAKAWQDAGYDVVSLRLDSAGWVRFKRRTAATKKP